MATTDGAQPDYKHRDDLQYSSQEEPKTSFAKVQGKPLFIVSGQDELTLYDGTKLRIDPAPVPNEPSDEPQLCQCGHRLDEHSESRSECHVPDCDCPSPVPSDSAKDNGRDNGEPSDEQSNKANRAAGQLADAKARDHYWKEHVLRLTQSDKPSDTHKLDIQREALVEKLNRLVAKAHGLPVDDLPKGVGLLSPNIDTQRLADEILADREAYADKRALEAALEEYKLIQYSDSWKYWETRRADFIKTREKILKHKLAALTQQNGEQE